MPTSVLIVDDHPSFRASARRMLEANGYSVVGEAADGEAAIAAAGALGPDLVLLDVQLPDLDGFEVAARIAALDRRRARDRPHLQPRPLRLRRRGRREPGARLHRQERAQRRDLRGAGRMSSLRRALLALGVLAFLAGIGSAALILTSDHASPRGLAAALILDRRLELRRHRPLRLGPPARQQHRAADDGGRLHLVLPGADVVEQQRRLRDRDPRRRRSPTRSSSTSWSASPPAASRAASSASSSPPAYLTTTVLQLAWAIFIDPTKQSDCEGCPENPILIGGHEGIADVINAFQVTLGSFAIAATVVIVFLRWRRSTPAQRRALTPVVLTGGDRLHDPAGAADPRPRSAYPRRSRTAPTSPRSSSSPPSPSPSCSGCCARGSAGPRRSPPRSAPRTSS